MRLFNSKYLLTLSLVGIVALLSACSGGKTPVYSQFVDIPTAGWDSPLYCDFATARQDSALFSDSARRYDVVIVVRHTDEYPYADLYISLSSTPFSCMPAERRINMASRTAGRPGKSAHGIYTVADTVARGISLPRLFDMKVSQAMRRERLPGIVNVGVVILPSS